MEPPAQTHQSLFDPKQTDVGAKKTALREAIYSGLCESYLNVISRVPVNVIQHQVGSSHQIKPHASCFGAQQKHKVLRVGTVETVNQPLSLVGGGVAV